MKCLLVYFSSTGITPMIATNIAKGINKENEWDIDYYRLKKNQPISVDGYDLIGIGGPSYSFRAPRLQTKLLKKIDFLNKPYFVFATYNTKVGNTSWNIHNSVRKTAGVCLGYHESSVAVNIKAWKPKITSDKKLKTLELDVKDQAIEFGMFVNQRYSKFKDVNESVVYNPPKKPGVRFWSAFLTWNWQMLMTVGFKRIDKEKCTQCMLCIDVICPSLAIIEGKNSFPRIKERNCVGCNGCVNLCPEDAIWTYQTRKRKSYDLFKKYILNDFD